MNPPPDHTADPSPILESASDRHFPLEDFAEISGVSVERIQLYLEQGLILPAPGARSESSQFDTHTLRTLRRIEHVRVTFGINTAGLRLIRELLAEIDRLQAELRRRPPNP